MKGAAASAPFAPAGIKTVMQSPDKSPSPPDHKAANRRLGLILLSIVVVFFLGFFAKMKFLG
ncbi:conserved hypothetical protein [Cupriavidus taiwanensis LMG 19424]|uniref:Uncharacterized protein n=1 Tax=Cupriavidus taiwanensis (strain DSM 17343 / BCRC 17206 / CCUG 44338 / CIP 107171 / LMG 19424 / R1) TaxID=977880 RepID=B2AGR0_CUPTR|nr:conserved hypothetical protein [Cupriavidus taiwanensis LMG 19424]